MEWDAALLLLQDIESSSSSWSEEEEEEESRSSTRERPAEEWDDTVEDVPLILFMCVCECVVIGTAVTTMLRCLDGEVTDR